MDIKDTIYNTSIVLIRQKLDKIDKEVINIIKVVKRSIIAIFKESQIQVKKFKKE